MTRDREWHISKGINLSFIFALLVQCAVAVWFFSALDQRVENLETHFQETRAELERENLRQWSRINDNEELTKSTLAAANTTSAILERLERDIQNMREDMRRNNELLREYIKGGN